MDTLVQSGVADSLAYIGAISQIVVALVAVTALIIAWRQVQASKQLSALEAYERYHILCLEYPNFGSGQVRLENAKRLETDQYCVFVSYALMTAERILMQFPSDEAWVEAVKDDIRIHRKMISSDYFKPYRHNQTAVVASLIEEVLSEPQVQA